MVNLAVPLKHMVAAEKINQNHIIQIDRYIYIPQKYAWILTKQ